MAAIGRMGPILLAIVVIMANCGAQAASAPAPSQTCDDNRYTDCYSFVLGADSKPSSSCCSNLTYIVTYQPKCICELSSLASNPTYSSYIPRALTLFGNCSLSSDAYNSCSNSSSGPAPAPTSGSGTTGSPSPKSSSAILSAPSLLLVSALIALSAASSLRIS